MKCRMDVVLKVAVEDLSTNERIAWQHRISGLGSKQAAIEMGCDVKQVQALWRNAVARRKPSKSGRVDMSLSAHGRCKCGLLLPCVCLPTIEELATSRVGEGGGEPARANHGGNAKTGARCR